MDRSKPVSDMTDRELIAEWHTMSGDANDSNRYERPTLTGLAWLESGFSEFRCFEWL